MNWYHAIKYVFLLIILIIITTYFIASDKNLIQGFSTSQTRESPEETAKYFSEYILDTANDYITCPLPDNPKIKPKLQKGFEWYYQKAFQGNEKAQYIIGNAYLSGIGTSINLEQAMQWLYKSASQGYAPAQSGYALMLSYDKNLQQTLSKKEIELQKLFWIKKAAAQGDYNGKILLINYYLEQENFSKAIQLATELTNINYIYAQLILGDIYLYGEGVSANPEKALYWYMQVMNNKKPAKFAVKHALLQLREIYSTSGKYQDATKAAYWLNQYKAFDKKIHCE